MIQVFVKINQRAGLYIQPKFLSDSVIGRQGGGGDPDEVVPTTSLNSAKILIKKDLFSRLLTLKFYEPPHMFGGVHEVVPLNFGFMSEWVRGRLLPTSSPKFIALK